MTIKIPYQYNSIIPKGVDVPISNSDIDMDNSEHYDEGFHQVDQIGDENEFWGIEFENLVLLERPKHILQLILQEQVDGFMEEEIIDTNDYVDWLKWVSDVERR